MGNGNVLKLAFLIIVMTLCALLVALTLGAAFFHLPLEDYTRLVGMLGIMGIFGGVVQAYIHANIADKAYSSPTMPIQAPTATSAQITTTSKEETKP